MAMFSIEEAMTPERCKEHCMAVTRDHLRRNRLLPEAELGADIFFHTRVDIGECADGTGNSACCDFRARRNEAGTATCHFGIENAQR